MNWRGTAAAATVLLVGASGVSHFVDPDIWHSMSLARETLALGRVPLDDSFAYTPTVSPVVHHEWLWGMLLYGLGLHGGIAALQALRVVLLVALVALIVWAARERGTPASALVGFAAPALPLLWTAFTAVRAQVATLVLTAVWLVFIEADRRGSRRWIVPALVLHFLWLNLHAGFVVGMGLLGVHAAEQAVRRRPAAHVVAVLVAMAALTLATPYGAAYPRYLAAALTMPRGLIPEWGPVTSAPPVVAASYWMSVLLATCALAAVGPRRAQGAALLVVTAYLGARHLRHVSIYALVWLTQVPGLLGGTGAGKALARIWARPLRAPGLAACGFLLAVGAATFVVAQPWRLGVPGGFSPKHPAYPVGAVDDLAARGIRGNLLVPFEAGAYVSWRLHPAVRVSIDGRFEAAYAPDLLAEHLAFYAAAPGWEDTLTRYPTDLILAPRRAAVVGRLDALAAWARAYEDDDWVVFARRDAGLQLVSLRGVRDGTFP